MTRLLVLFAMLFALRLPAQHALHCRPVFRGENITLGEALTTVSGDTLRLHTLRFYLGDFVFWKNGAIVLAEKNRYRLLDLEDENSLTLRFDLPENTGFDSLSFVLGVDSATTAAGAMGGDLDPTKGMFWSWQSGYINLKLEGKLKGSEARPQVLPAEFQFHLGGYLPPFQTIQVIRIGRISDPANLRLDFDLAPFFEAVDWGKKPNIMSPGPEAKRLSGVLSTAFGIHEN